MAVQSKIKNNNSTKVSGYEWYVGFGKKPPKWYEDDECAILYDRFGYSIYIRNPDTKLFNLDQPDMNLRSRSYRADEILSKAYYITMRITFYVKVAHYSYKIEIACTFVKGAGNKKLWKLNYKSFDIYIVKHIKLHNRLSKLWSIKTECRIKNGHKMIYNRFSRQSSVKNFYTGDFKQLSCTRNVYRNRKNDYEESLWYIKDAKERLKFIKSKQLKAAVCKRLIKDFIQSNKRTYCSKIITIDPLQLIYPYLDHMFNYINQIKK